MRRTLVFVAVVALSSMPGAGDTLGEYSVWLMVEPTMTREATLRQFTFKVGCYDADRGHLLDCDSVFQSYFGVPDDAVGTDVESWAGGHLHPSPANPQDPARPIATLCCPGVDPRQDPCPPPGLEGDVPAAFAGPTLGLSWIATKTIPQVSGTITMFGLSRSPPGYRCVDGAQWRCDPYDPSHQTHFVKIALKVAVDGLVELPPDRELYVRCGKDGCVQENDVYKEHPHPFYATPRMREAVQLLAYHYNEFHRQRNENWRLRILDMSLPWGGLMEADPTRATWRPTLTECATWPPPPGRPGHCWHRVGESVDIGQFALDDTGRQVSTK